MKNSLLSRITSSEEIDPSTVKTFKKRFNIKRSLPERFADGLTTFSGGFIFLIVNIAWFSVWITINLDLIPGIEPFDPYPFGLLTLIVSLEAIILTIIVLISQNRETTVNHVRSEIDANVDIITEEKVSKALQLLYLIAEKQDIDLSDEFELISMLTPTDHEQLESEFEVEVKGK